MPSPFLAGDSPHYGTGDYYYPAPPPPPTATGSASPFMNGPGMPLPMMVNQFGATTTEPTTPPTHGYYPAHHMLSNTSNSTTPPPPPLQPVTMISPSVVAASLASSNSTPPPPADQEYGDFMYHAGFLQGRLADTLVDIPSIQKTYPLHALILARSPTIHRMLLSDQCKPTVTNGGRKRYTIRLTPQQLPGSVTEEAVHATLGHLYRPMHHQDVMYLFARPRTLLSILDLADYLEIQPLTSMIYDALAHEWNVETILFWLPYLTPQSTASLAFGIHYLTQTLPQQLDAFYNDNYMELAHVYAHLPLGLLESCIEADQLNVRDPMQRLAFAKQVMLNRQQWMEADDGLSVALRFHQGEVAVKVIHPSP